MFSLPVAVAYVWPGGRLPGVRPHQLPSADAFCLHPLHMATKSAPLPMFDQARAETTSLCTSSTFGPHSRSIWAISAEFGLMLAEMAQPRPCSSRSRRHREARSNMPCCGPPPACVGIQRASITCCPRGEVVGRLASERPRLARVWGIHGLLRGDLHSGSPMNSPRGGIVRKLARKWALKDRDRSCRCSRSHVGARAKLGDRWPMSANSARDARFQLQHQDRRQEKRDVAETMPKLIESSPKGGRPEPTCGRIGAMF